MIRGIIGGGLTLLGTAGLGAAAMYLFDPDQGWRRRKHLAKAAEEAWSSAGERLGEAWEQARQYGQRVGEEVQEHGQRLGQYAGSDRLRRLWRSEPESQWGTTATVLLTALGALAVGAGLMYLFDPQQGPGRRAQARDQMRHAMESTRQTLARTGQYLRERGEEAAETAEQAR